MKTSKNLFRIIWNYISGITVFPVFLVLVILLYLVYKIVIIGFFILLIFIHTQTKYEDKIYYNVTDLPEKEVALIFGAGVWSENRLTSILHDRVLTGIEVYENGKTNFLLMSGDNSSMRYNEPQAMRQFAEKNGVPVQAIFHDFAGFRTYDSCYRAREIFDIDEMIIITQRYHMPRALYTCNELGIDCIGIVADHQRYSSEVKYIIREIPATMLAWIEINLTMPKPKFLGQKETVPW